MSWEKTTLGTIIDIKKGKAITKKDSKEGPYPVILGGREPAYYIDQFNHTGKAIVVSRSGASAGYVSFWDEAIFVTDGFLIEPKESVDIDYLYYLMKAHEQELMGLQGGSAIPHVTPKIIGGISIDLPDVDLQRKISEVLKSYDDLIENNKKQIKLLEEAAQRLYREWFVELRFPGYEGMEIVDGVPAGWERKRLVDIVDVQYGYAFDSSMFNDVGNGMPIIRIRNIPYGNTTDFTTEEAEEKYVISNGEILVGMDGEFHINSWSGDNAYLVQRTCCFRPRKNEMNGWILWAIYEPIKFYEKTVVGATVSHLGKKHIDAIELLTGPDELYIPFQILFEQRQNLLNQNNLLSEARDRLLPKLMSGEIEV